MKLSTLRKFLEANANLSDDTEVVVTSGDHSFDEHIHVSLEEIVKFNSYRAGTKFHEWHGDPADYGYRSQADFDKDAVVINVIVIS